MVNTMSVRVEYDNEAQGGELATDANGLTDLSGGMETAVLLSLFSDRRAEDDDDVPEGASKRGWWGDSLSEDGDQWGSRLWLLDRAKMTEETLQLAKEYAEESLQWMVADGIAQSVTATAIKASSSMIGLSVVIVKADGSQWDGTWSLTTNGV